jgi:hypothetical protein
MSLILNILHYSIYLFSFITLLSLIIRGNKAKLEAFYIGSFLIIQSLYNGCPITTIQNYFWVKEGLLPAQNEFILLDLSFGYVSLLRFIIFLVGIYLISIKIFDKK